MRVARNWNTVYRLAELAIPVVLKIKKNKLLFKHILKYSTIEKIKKEPGKKHHRNDWHSSFAAVALAGADNTAA